MNPQTSNSKSSPTHCLDCGQDLRGLRQPRCPECGRRFHPVDPRTGERSATRASPILFIDVLRGAITLKFCMILGLLFAVFPSLLNARPFNRQSLARDLSTGLMSFLAMSLLLRRGHRPFPLLVGSLLILVFEFSMHSYHLSSSGAAKPFVAILSEDLRPALAAVAALLVAIPSIRLAFPPGRPERPGSV